MAITLKGLKAVQAQLKSIEAEARPKLMRSAMRAAFKPVLEDAMARVPVDSGELRAGIKLSSAKVKSDGLAVGLTVSSNTTALKQARTAAAAFGEAQSKSLPPARRWHFVELGTARKGARPFLRPALEANQQGVIDDLAKQLDKKIRRAIKKRGKR